MDKDEASARFLAARAVERRGEHACLPRIQREKRIFDSSNREAALCLLATLDECLRGHTHRPRAHCTRVCVCVHGGKAKRKRRGGPPHAQANAKGNSLVESSPLPGATTRNARSPSREVSISLASSCFAFAGRVLGDLTQAQDDTLIFGHFRVSIYFGGGAFVAQRALF